MEFWKIIPIFAQGKRVVIKLFDLVSFPGSSSFGKNKKIKKKIMWFTVGRIEK